MSESQHLDVSRRNAASVMETLNRQDMHIQEQHKQIAEMGASMATLYARMNALESLVYAHKARAMGHGPTVT